MTDVTGRNRVQAGVPTGGQFATEVRGENADLGVDEHPMATLRLSDFVTEDEIDFARETLGEDADEDAVQELATERAMIAYEEYLDELDERFPNGTDEPARDYAAENAEILGMVKQHAKWGLFKSNGRGTYLGEVTLSRSYMGPVTLDIAIHPFEADRDEEGNPIDQCWSLNLFPHKPVGNGRTRSVSLAEAFAFPEAGKISLRRAEREELLALVDKYDRNVMQLGTAKQRAQYDTIFAEEVGTKEFATAEARDEAYQRTARRANEEIAEDNGHQWGDGRHRMVRPIPPQDFKRILELLDEAKTSRATRKPD